jgi:phosphoserine phosphatase
MSLRVLLSAAAVFGLLLGVGVGMASSEKAVDTRELTKERMEAARDAYQFAWDEFKPFDLSKGDGEKVYRWSRRWMEAECDLATTKAERVAALQGHFERTKKLEEEVQAYTGSTIPFQQLAATKFYRAEAETWLAEAKDK